MRSRAIGHVAVTDGATSARRRHAGAGRSDGGRDVLVLGSDELAEAIPLSLVIDAVEHAYRLAGTGALEQPPRVPLQQAGVRTFLHLMPAMSGSAGIAGVHVYTGGNRGADVPQKLTVLFRTEDGALRAMIESSWLSWARTGATGAVATRHLARPDADVLGIIGAGRQARAQLQAIAASRQIRRAYVFSPTAERRQAFARDMTRATGVEVEPLDSADAVVARSDIVSTATTAREPVFDAAAVHAGLHVNAIGAHYPDRREIDGPTIARALLFADEPERSNLEDGELALAIADGTLEPGTAATSLASVVAGTTRGRRSADDVTVFLSGGLGSEYVLVAGAIVDRAQELGLGTRVRL